MEKPWTPVFGIDLYVASTEEGGRSGPLLNRDGQQWEYRPNWGLPSMTPPEQAGAQVLAFSRDEVRPGERVHAVIAPRFPEIMPPWELEVVPGVVLTMYEGTRVCGHGTVLWRSRATLPLTPRFEQAISSWLRDPTTPFESEE